MPSMAAMAALGLLSNWLDADSPPPFCSHQRPPHYPPSLPIPSPSRRSRRGRAAPRIGRRPVLCCHGLLVLHPSPAPAACPDGCAAPSWSRRWPRHSRGLPEPSGQSPASPLPGPSSASDPVQPSDAVRHTNPLQLSPPQSMDPAPDPGSPLLHRPLLAQIERARAVPPSPWSSLHPYLPQFAVPLFFLQLAGFCFAVH